MIWVALKIRVDMYERLCVMLKSIGSLVILVCFSSMAGAQGTMTTSIVVLRNSEPSLEGVVVVDRVTGDLVRFNSDGELMDRHELEVQLVATGKSGLWIANDKSVMQHDLATYQVVVRHDFEYETQPVGLVVR